MRTINAGAAVFAVLIAVTGSPASAQPCGGNGELPCARWVCDEPGPFGSCLRGHTDFNCSGSLQNIAGRCSRCGGSGEVTCVSGATCGDRLNAVPPIGGAGVCLPCGRRGLPFCASGAACDGGLTVVAGFCVPTPPTPPCGAAGQPACASGPRCGNRLNAVGPPVLQVCLACGRNGLPACQNQPACDSGFGVFAGLCWPTGQATRPAMQLSGIFREGSDPTAVWVGAEWDAFSAQWGTFEAQGLRMVDFETYVEDGRRKYAGVFRAGTNPPLAMIGKEWTEFKADWDRFEQQGFRMHDLEIWNDGGKRKFGGVFTPGTFRSAAVIARPWSEFSQEWGRLEGEGQRMFDLETFEEGGSRLYAGIFRPGTFRPAAWVGLPWGDFQTKWRELEQNGYRMTDFENYPSGGQRAYAGVFAPGTDRGGAWIGVDSENFFAKWRQFESSGVRLTDLELREGTCDVSCANQVTDRCMVGGPNCPYTYGVTATATHCEGRPGSCPTTATGKVDYQTPFDVPSGTTEKILRLSAVEIPDKIFTLPVENATGMNHNGWLYGAGNWHHAIDYGRTPSSTFRVVAAAPGRVIHIGWDDWSGNTIVVSHDAGGVTDAYRTLYMHLRAGAAADCVNAWDLTMPTLSGDNKDNYTKHLEATGCPKDATKRNPTGANWGSNETIDPALLNQTVTRGQFLAWAGETGPGGNNSPNANLNTHLHIFWARRDPSNDKWYLFDPYGIYGRPSCYPTGMTDALDVPCARYPVAFRDGRPQFP